MRYLPYSLTLISCLYCNVSTIPVRAWSNSSIGHWLVPYRYWHCHDGVHFQYGHLPSACTSIGNAAMEFISRTGTCQVPIPVLALPRWSSFPVWALAKCPYQYWYGYSLPKLVNMLVPKHANYQYQYGAAQYQYWYPYSNSLVFTFLSTFFQVR